MQHTVFVGPPSRFYLSHGENREKHGEIYHMMSATVYTTVTLEYIDVSLCGATASITRSQTEEDRAV